MVSGIMLLSKNMEVREFIQSKEFKPLSVKLVDFARSLTRDNYKADDLYQETIYKMIRNQHLYTDGNFSGWCTKIMYNTFINDYRKESSLSEMYLGDDNQNAIIDNLAYHSQRYSKPDAESNLVIDEISSLFDVLPDEFRGIYHDYVVHGYNSLELGKIYDVIPATVRTRIFRAKNTMRPILTKIYNSDNKYKATLKDKYYEKVKTLKNAKTNNR
jgi:RNA polymerase sigma-70 factor, ECF subfamily